MKHERNVRICILYSSSKPLWAFGLGTVDRVLEGAYMSNYHTRDLQLTGKVILIPNYEMYPNIRCFAVIDEEDVVDKRSYKSIINGYNQKEDVNHCLRWLVKPQIDEWKASHPMPEKCSLCNKPIENPHIDHVVPFRYIFYNNLRLLT